MVTVESREGRVGIAPQEETSIPKIMAVITIWIRFMVFLKSIDK
jgi:hypothetical protein